MTVTLTARIPRPRGQRSVGAPPRRLGGLIRSAALVAYFVLLSILSQVQATLGGRSANPMTFVANMTFSSVQWASVNPLLDGSPGRIKQALGQLGVNLFLHGHSPWWNPYNGLGSVLASDLQSAVFYPFSLLVYGLRLGGTGPDLVALLDVVVGGLSAYWLARELGIGRRGALLAGTAYCLSGSFVWFGTLMGDVIAWTPASLACTVRLLRPASRSRLLDVLGLTSVTAVQILGGFPESLALQLLVLTLPLTVAGIVRLAGGRLLALLRVAAGFGLGFVVTAFFWIPFVTLLPAEIVWNQPGRALLHAPVWANLALLVPFAFGHWFDTSSLSVINWYQLGGYVGVVATWLAVVGTFGGWHKHRPVVVPLAVAVLIALVCVGGLPPISWLVHLPGLGRVPFDRLAVAPLTMAVAILAGLAVTLQLTWKVWLGATLFSAGSLAVLVDAAPHGVARGELVFSLVCLASIALGLPAFQGAARWIGQAPARRLLALGGSGLALAVVAVELLSLANLDNWNLPARNQVPTLSRPPAWVGYVQTHLHGGRLYAANNLLVPNYSADLGIKELSFQDAVEPRAATDFVSRSIAPGIPTAQAFGGNPMQLTLPRHLKDLELAGVTLLALPDPGCQALCAPLRLRYLDRKAKVGIFAVPQPQRQVWFPAHVQPGRKVPKQLLRSVSVTAPLRRAFRGAASAKPVAVTASRLQLSVQAKGPRLLVVRQVNFPGWRARVNGKPAALLTVDGVFQGVEVPAGHSEVTVSYTPPGLRLGEAISLLAVIAGAAAIWTILRRQGRLPPARRLGRFAGRGHTPRTQDRLPSPCRGATG